MNPQADLIGYPRSKPPPNFGFPPHRSGSPGINLCDNLSDVVDKWLTKDGDWRIDPDHFVKILPFTTNDLRQGWVDPRQVTESVLATFMARTTRDERTRMVQNIAIRASGNLGWRIANLREIGGAMREFDWLFETAVAGRFGLNSLPTGMNPSAMSTLCSCLEDSWDGFEDYLFFRSSPCQRLPREVFLMKEWLRTALIDCALKIAAGTDLPEDRCWRCGAVLRNAGIPCRGCHVAKYCSENCRQIASLMHNSQHCGWLSDSLMRLEAGFNEIQKKAGCLWSKQTHRSYFLSLKVDLRVLFSLLTQDAARFSHVASVSHFYAYLFAVLENSWWFFPRALDEAEQYDASRPSRTVQAESDEFSWLCYCLAFDYSGQYFDASPNPHPMYAYAVASGTYFGQTDVAGLQHFNFPPMPPHVFVELYQAQIDVVDRDRRLDSFRRAMIKHWRLTRSSP